MKSLVAVYPMSFLIGYSRSIANNNMNNVNNKKQIMYTSIKNIKIFGKSYTIIYNLYHEHILSELYHSLIYTTAIIGIDMSFKNIKKFK